MTSFGNAPSPLFPHRDQQFDFVSTLWSTLENEALGQKICDTVTSKLIAYLLFLLIDSREMMSGLFAIRIGSLELQWK